MLVAVKLQFHQKHKKAEGLIHIMSSSPNLSLWENFIEAIAQILSRALSDNETEKLVGSVGGIPTKAYMITLIAFQKRLREISVENFNKFEKDAKSKRFCKHKGSCTDNCLFSILRSFSITFGVKYLLGFVPSLLTGKIFKRCPSSCFGCC